MSMTEEKFLQAYGELLLNVWADEELKARLNAEPASVLKEHGLDPGSATVTVAAPDVANDTVPDKARVSTSLQHFSDGVAAGNVVFILPDAPTEDLASSGELSEAELDAVAGGGMCCCCCCPCCCCGGDETKVDGDQTNVDVGIKLS